LKIRFAHAWYGMYSGVHWLSILTGDILSLKQLNLSKSVDQFPRKSTQIIWFVNRHLTLSTAYSQLFAGDYLHDMGKQGAGFVAVS
jgi:hypothetical protein